MFLLETILWKTTKMSVRRNVNTSKRCSSKEGKIWTDGEEYEMITVSPEMCYGISIDGEKKNLIITKRILPTKTYAVKLTGLEAGERGSLRKIKKTAEQSNEGALTLLYWSSKWMNKQLQSSVQPIC